MSKFDPDLDEKFKLTQDIEFSEEDDNMYNGRLYAKLKEKHCINADGNVFIPKGTVVVCKGADHWFLPEFDEHCFYYRFEGDDEDSCVLKDLNESIKIDPEVQAVLNEDIKKSPVTWSDFMDLEKYARYDVQFKHISNSGDKVYVAKANGKYQVLCPSTGTLAGDKIYEVDTPEEIDKVIQEHFANLDYQDIQITDKKIFAKSEASQPIKEAYNYPTYDSGITGIGTVEFSTRGGKQVFENVMTKWNESGPIECEIVHNHEKAIARITYDEKFNDSDLETAVQNIEVLDPLYWYMFIELMMGNEMKW